MGKLEKVTVELDSETVAAAAAAGLDLSKELTLALRRRLPLPTAQDREEAARRWQAENRSGIESYSRMIEEDGFVFSDGGRTF